MLSVEKKVQITEERKIQLCAVQDNHWCKNLCKALLEGLLERCISFIFKEFAPCVMKKEDKAQRKLSFPFVKALAAD